jgi:uncharacterized membrane protein YkvA (DUF1232 family)
MTMKFLSKVKALYHRVIVNGFLVYKIFVNPKTPWYIRLLLLIPLAYVLFPIDFVADAIPILGQLDDLAVLRYGYFILLKIVPKPVLEECRQKVQAKLDVRRESLASPGKGSKDP